MAANRHLAKARDYIGKGEDYYRKAAKEIATALKEGATQREIAEYLGRSKTWVADIVQWGTSGQDTDQPTPWAGPRGEARETSTARKVLEHSTPAQVREMIDTLPAQAREDVARAAYDSLRVDDEREAVAEANEAPHERKAREAKRERTRKQIGVFEVQSRLRKAHRELQEAVRLLRETELSAADLRRVRRFFERTRETMESVELALETDAVGDWDMALAELAQGGE